MNNNHNLTIQVTLQRAENRITDAEHGLKELASATSASDIKRKFRGIILDLKASFDVINRSSALRNNATLHSIIRNFAASPEALFVKTYKDSCLHAATDEISTKETFHNTLHVDNLYIDKVDPAEEISIGAQGIIHSKLGIDGKRIARPYQLKPTDSIHQHISRSISVTLTNFEKYFSAQPQTSQRQDAVAAEKLLLHYHRLISALRKRAQD